MTFLAESVEALAALLEYIAMGLRKGIIESFQTVSGDHPTRVIIVFKDRIVPPDPPKGIEFEDTELSEDSGEVTGVFSHE